MNMTINEGKKDDLIIDYTWGSLFDDDDDDDDDLPDNVIRDIGSWF